MNPAKICTSICKLLVVCGYIMTFLILSPFLAVIIALVIPMWLGQKIIECASKK